MIHITNQFLHTDCRNIEDYNKAFRIANEIHTWLKGKSNAIAVAFNQVGYDFKAFVIRKHKQVGLKLFVYMNPKYIQTANSQLIKSREGCLSYPGKMFIVPRYTEISAVYYDYYQQMYVTEIMRGTPAIVFQHETDHVYGISCADMEIKDEDKTIKRNDDTKPSSPSEEKD